MPPRSRSNKSFYKPQNTKATFRRIFSYLKPFRLRLILVTFCILIATASQVAGTAMLRTLIDNAIMPQIGSPDPDFTLLISTVITMGVIYLVGIIALFTYQQIMVTISTRTLKTMRDDLFTHLQDLPIKYFDQNTHGDIMSRFTNDIDTLREMISGGLPQIISSAITIVSVFAMMCFLSVPLTVIVVAMLFIIMIILKNIMGKSRINFIKQQEQIGTVNGYVEEMVEGQRVVKVFCHEDKIKSEFKVLNEELADSSTKAQTYVFLLFPIMGNISHLHYVITAIVGASLILAQPTIASWNSDFLSWLLNVSVGSLITFMTYTRNFSQPISQISQQFNGIISALAGAERIFAVLDQKPEDDEGYVELVNVDVNETGQLVESVQRTGKWAWRHPHNADGTVTYKELKGDVVFEHVTFSYDGKKKVLDDISLYAKPGQKVAFVGSTGAGKTTITNLINRFYDIDGGKIRYDGININKIKKDDLRHSLAMVLQDTHLFTGTVRENIRYGKLDATDEEVIDAAHVANAHWFIEHLPQGYDTLLTADGANLSQGQRQLLAIARAAVANPPVLILDEATSSIDTRTEKLIERGMDQLMDGRTVFVIAHRLSTVRNADAIMVLEHGKIIERGNHDELIAKKGKYYQLYTGAFELE